MNAIRSWTTFVGSLCLAGATLLAGTTVCAADSDSYALRLSRLDDSASRGTWDGYFAGAQPMKPAFAGNISDPNAPHTPGSAYEQAAGNSEDCGCQLPACCGRCAQNFYAYVGGM